MKKITVVTAARSEYGILKPLISKLKQESQFQVQLVATGTHLVKKHGNTQEEILQDGNEIYEKIPILESGNTSCDISFTIANAAKNFALYFAKEKPDLLIVLGDRTELLGICSAAINERVPIAHLHGGELTEGAVDDCVRHAVTKMSYLHFPSTEEYRRRIIQMGEHPERVFAVGALGIENILKTPLLDRKEICEKLGIPFHQAYVMVTFHPVTLENQTPIQQVKALIQAIKQKEDYFYYVTKANADAGGDEINQFFEKLASQQKNVKLAASLGTLKYLSAVKHSAFVLGNSSSGIIEAPALGTPSINIGDRQKGRIMPETVINCEPDKNLILAAMEIAAHQQRYVSLRYGDGNTSDKIIVILKKHLFREKIDLKKTFYDIKIT